MVEPRSGRRSRSRSPRRPLAQDREEQAVITEAFLSILEGIPSDHAGAKDYCVKFFDQARRFAVTDLRFFQGCFREEPVPCMLAARSTEVNVKLLDAAGQAKFTAARVKELVCQEKYTAIRFLSQAETKEVERKVQRRFFRVDTSKLGKTMQKRLPNRVGSSSASRTRRRPRLKGVPLRSR